ncbi:MAG: hypothetical protein GVY27_05885 [Deinococcus-Thermus bacterium]|nr:hypothetical protein [Deinococcota bacterium]
MTPESEGAVNYARAPAAESPGRVRLGYVRAGGDFEAASSEAAFPGEEAATPAESGSTLVLTTGEATAMAERWLAEGRVARDAARFALPPSAFGLGAGDVVTLEDGGNYRIDRAEMGEAQVVEAVRVEPGAYVAPDSDDSEEPVRPYDPPAPVAPIFMDLPLLTGEEVPHAPHLAVAAEPWPGPVAVYRAPDDADYQLDQVVEAPATLGVTLDPLPARAPGRWDRGPALRVRLATGGPLTSAAAISLFAGANAFAIGDGSPGRWEIFQARDVQLVAPDTYAIGMRLRGQLGTDGDIAPEWPAGSRVVRLDGTPQQIALAAEARGLERHFVIGPSALPLGDPSMVRVKAAFEGIGLRPYSPVHLRARERPDGGLDVRWIRRTRIDGDSWAGEEVPLGEEREQYRLRVVDAAGGVLRQTDVSAPEWTWSAAARTADATATAIEVAQVSRAYGPGPYRRIEIDG